MSRYTVVFDACVLYPVPLRDLLMQLATADLFRAKWMNRIHEEWIQGLLDRRPDLDRQALERTRRLMDAAVMDCLVHGYEHLIPTVRLPDENDRHVVAAAIHARSDAIITFNLADFPAAELGRYNLEAIHPDDFLTYQADLDQSKVLTAAKQIRARLTKPPRTVEEYLAALEAQSLPKTVAVLRDYAALI